MVDRRFEAVARYLTGPATPRRSAMKRLSGLLAGVLMGGLAGIVADGAEAQRKRRCRRNKRRCGKKCKDLQNDRANCGSCGRRCGVGQGCFEGVCLTAEGTCSAVSPCVGLVPCNGSGGCLCSQSVSGTTRCGAVPPTGFSVCGECTIDVHCSARFGAGAFCSPCCGITNQCFVPCPV